MSSGSAASVIGVLVVAGAAATAAICSGIVDDPTGVIVPPKPKKLSKKQKEKQKEKARRRKQKSKEKERARKAKREGEGARRGRAQPEPEPQAFDMTVIDADAEAEAAEAERRERARAGARTPQTPPKSTTSDPNDMSERPASRRVRPYPPHEMSVLAPVHKPSAVG